MRKWIVLTFVLGFIAGGATLYFVRPAAQQQPSLHQNSEDQAGLERLSEPAPEPESDPARDELLPIEDESIDEPAYNDAGDETH